MALVDPKAIGNGKGRQFQDPADAERAANGVYQDPASAVPMQQKVPCGPSAPDPSPFGVFRKVNGGT